MSYSTKIYSAAAFRYANALLELAQADGVLEKVERDLQDVKAMIGASADFRSLIRSPLLNADQQSRAMLALADKARLQDLTKNTLGVLIQNRRLNLLEGVIVAFGEELSRRRGEVEVQVETAEKLDDSQAQDLAKKIAGALQLQVTVNAQIRPEILGGMVVTVGSRMIDHSVARKLERLKASMMKPAEKAA